MNLAPTVKVELSPFQALALVRWQALTADTVINPQGARFTADARDAADAVAAALEAWLSAPLLPMPEPVEAPKRKRGRPRKDAAPEKKPDVFDAAKAARIVAEHPATKGAAPAIIGDPEGAP